MTELNMMSKEQFDELVKGKQEECSGVSVIDLEKIYYQLRCCRSLVLDLSGTDESITVSSNSLCAVYQLLDGITHDLENLIR